MNTSSSSDEEQLKRNPRRYALGHINFLITKLWSQTQRKYMRTIRQRSLIHYETSDIFSVLIRHDNVLVNLEIMERFFTVELVKFMLKVEKNFGSHNTMIAISFLESFIVAKYLMSFESNNMTTRGRLRLNVEEANMMCILEHFFEERYKKFHPHPQYNLFDILDRHQLSTHYFELPQIKARRWNKVLVVRHTWKREKRETALKRLYNKILDYDQRMSFIKAVSGESERSKSIDNESTEIEYEDTRGGLPKQKAPTNLTSPPRPSYQDSPDLISTEKPFILPLKEGKSANENVNSILRKLLTDRSPFKSKNKTPSPRKSPKRRYESTIPEFYGLGNVNQQNIVTLDVNVVNDESAPLKRPSKRRRLAKKLDMSIAEKSDMDIDNDVATNNNNKEIVCSTNDCKRPQNNPIPAENKYEIKPDEEYDDYDDDINLLTEYFSLLETGVPDNEFSAYFISEFSPQINLPTINSCYTDKELMDLDGELPIYSIDTAIGRVNDSYKFKTDKDRLERLYNMYTDFDHTFPQMLGTKELSIDFKFNRVVPFITYQFGQEVSRFPWAKQLGCLMASLTLAFKQILIRETLGRMDVKMIKLRKLNPKQRVQYELRHHLPYVEPMESIAEDLREDWKDIQFKMDNIISGFDKLKLAVAQRYPNANNSMLTDNKDTIFKGDLDLSEVS